MRPLPYVINIPTPIAPEFFEDVACAAAEGGINHWATVFTKYDADTDTYHYSFAENDDEGAPAGPVLPLSAELLVLGTHRIINHHANIAPQLYADLIGALRDNDAGMVDANLADCILQVAVFNEIRYS